METVLVRFPLPFRVCMIRVEHFSCVVKMLYNLQFTQAVAALSTKFSPEERQAWRASGALKKVNMSLIHNYMLLQNVHHQSSFLPIFPP